VTDPFGGEYDSIWDNNALYVREITDPAGNRTEAVYDCRFMLPAQITDPNGNRTAAQFDPLGRVTRVQLWVRLAGTGW
jgi:uncharacterized protein RhaS with RHS repeats